MSAEVNKDLHSSNLRDQDVQPSDAHPSDVLPKGMHSNGEHSSNHAGEAFHHHHSHAKTSEHVHGHHLLQIENLSTSFLMYDSSQKFFSAKKTYVETLHNLNLSIHVGEVLALVGESGAGKSLLAESILGIFDANAHVEGEVYFDGEQLSLKNLPKLRGREIAFMPQSISALDPFTKIGVQVQNILPGMSGQEKKERQLRQQDLFNRYNLALEVAHMYPHELSGGMARRVLLCMALIEKPRLLVVDEPTPGMDTRAVLQVLKDVKAFAQSGGSVLFITHDIGVAVALADRIAVCKDGSIVEETAAENFTMQGTLEHPFSQALVRALPENAFMSYDESEGKQGTVKQGASSSQERLLQQACLQGAVKHSSSQQTCSQTPSLKQGSSLTYHTLSVQNISFSYRHGHKKNEVLQNISFETTSKDRLAIVAPSGSGKTTLCNILAGYLSAQSGTISLDGVSAAQYASKQQKPYNGTNPVQLVSQHPELAFDPYLRIQKSLQEARRKETSSKTFDEELHILLESFEAEAEWLARYPHELSGGQLQRLNLARAFLSNPQFLVLDEISTMLDAVTQARIWKSVCSLAQARNIGIIFVSHNKQLIQKLATKTFELA